MRRKLGTLLGKGVARAVRLRGRSSGQAMPGLVVEKLVPGYLSAMLQQLPEGVVVVTGTNGKTTTTKMVVELLAQNGKRVLTNATGSNLTRGIISSLVQQAGRDGHLPFDIAVFELDEAYGRRFTEAVRPRWVLGLNASRDQLDRFGEVDKVARLVGDTMLAASEGIVVNADDKRLSRIAAEAPIPVRYYGVTPSLLRYFPRDDELVAVGAPAPVLEAAAVPLAVELLAFEDMSATYRIGKQRLQTRLAVTGQHNFQNAAGALALTMALLPKAASSRLVSQLAGIRPAFGRGQRYELADGSSVQLNLVKNPASFRQGLASYVSDDTHIMIAINDAVADSRDMSWLWDIDFTTLQAYPVAVTAGTRAADMALRLSYDEISVELIEPDLKKAFETFSRRPGEKIIFASYTAMLKLHALLDRKRDTR